MSRRLASPLVPGGCGSNASVRENAVVPVGTEPGALLTHAVAGRGVARKPVHRAREVQRLLYRPKVLMAVRREELRRVARRDPANGHRGARRELRIDVDDGMDADLAGRANGRAGKDRGPGGEKGPVLDDCAVDVRVRSNQHVLTEPRRAATPPAYERVLHDNGALADIGPAVLSGHNGSEEDPRASTDADITAQDGIRRHIRGRINGRAYASMLDQHAPYPRTHGRGQTAPTRGPPAPAPSGSRLLIPRRKGRCRRH